MEEEEVVMVKPDTKLVYETSLSPFFVGQGTPKLLYETTLSPLFVGQGIPSTQGFHY
jgi:hypothetical protein